MSSTHPYPSEMILWGGTGQAKVLNPIIEHFGSRVVAEVFEFAVKAWTMRSSQPALWLMFSMICFGLGYPTLNRYNPAQTQTDARQYFLLVSDGPSAAEDHWRYRILVPYLARPIYKVAAGHIGTWNPVSFSMLVVNSAFCASSALVLILIAKALGFQFATGLIAAFSYMLNFDVANWQLAGLVDSAEAFLMACLVLVLLKRSWNALPVLGILGGLAKETFVPIAFLFACGWVWSEKRKPWVQVCAMAAAGIAVVILVRSLVQGHLVTPLQIAGGVRGVSGLSDILSAAFKPLASWVVWITFLWLVPLAARGVARLPREAIYGTALGLIGAFALVVWTDAGGANASRPFFNIAGPCLCLAFAIAVTEVSTVPNANAARTSARPGVPGTQ